ncbi:hypothetical protein B566_EDAN000921 [Ephemera danica]|nr:hypothetical protein B566_EDAN000921 [Ephemera danica]
MPNMSSKMMSGDSPSASCEVISEVHHDYNHHHDTSTDYDSAATLRMPHRRDYMESDDKPLPLVGFIDPCDTSVTFSPPVTVAPARPTGEDDILEIPISVATQTDQDTFAVTDDPASEPPQLSSAETTKLTNDQKDDDGCGINCLYCIITCCDCVIM